MSLDHQQHGSPLATEVVQVTDESDKCLFEIVGRGEAMQVRAIEGHSLAVDNSAFQRQVPAEELPWLLYRGTMAHLYPSILASSLLDGGPRRSRAGIHFAGAASSAASGLPVISCL